METHQQSDLNEFLSRINGVISRQGEETSSETEENIIHNPEYNEIQRSRLKEDLRKAQLENDLIDERKQGAKQDREQRKMFADRIFSLVTCYLLFVFFLVFFSGSGFGRMSISDNVLIAILTTMTVNVIGLLVIVARYLFPSKSH